MTLSIWRWAHFTLAIITAVFLVIASVTGAILAIDSISQEIPSSYKASNFENIHLDHVIDLVKKEFIEVNELTVTPSHTVIVKGLDDQANEVNAYINPNTGKIIGNLKKQSEWIKWITSLHRSLFLHQTGRIILGINAFLLFIITCTGIILLLKRQNGFKGFIKKIKKDHWYSYLHVLLSRWMIIPIWIIALTGTFLTIYNLNVFEKKTVINHKSIISKKPISERQIKDFPIFKTLLLSDVQKIEFPFTDEVEEHFTLKLNDREILVNQWDGSILSEVEISKWIRLEKLSLDLHTGRGTILWSLILLVTVMSILFFITSGFIISYKRLRYKEVNKYPLVDSELIILVGSENGNTMRFATTVHRQFLKQGIKSFITSINQYQVFPSAHTILVFTSTYGDGNAPSNAYHFEELLLKYKQLTMIKTAVVGFGSSQYVNFCGYAKKVEQLLKKQTWNQTLLDLHTIDQQSMVNWLQWISSWNAVSNNHLSILENSYLNKEEEGILFKVIAKTEVENNCSNFILILSPLKKNKYQSGDLLAIYPELSSKERLYSIGKIDDTIQLMVKLHSNGLGSGFLYQLKEGQVLRGIILRNPKFYLPQDKKVIMIANGTGIAPFMGMIAESVTKHSLYLYAGFREESTFVKKLQDQAEGYKKQGKLEQFRFAFSRTGNRYHVTDLVNQDLEFILKLLQEGNVLMICGSIAMLKDIEELLENYIIKQTADDLNFYKSKGQILTDCY
ncbi:PepSY domain-containing protein [Flavobacterium oreochromis]|uniref:PepSY domain-containing protein n=1 Tax=Flavobacterium oreochromis TaxID=2906078 RepID=A0ABW8P7V0_9FLAO|nr:PepSY domain-containing protein [Flavobacterium oreochromis]OWP76060.1 hypothetical protein BWG23_09185 [Flavobacterium oreochromis]